jgi:hypothetical protein
LTAIVTARSSILPAALLLLFLALVAGGLMCLNGLVQDPMLPGERVPVVTALTPVPGSSRTALLFVSPSCRHCLQALERMSAMPATVRAMLTVVAAGPEQETVGLRERFPLHIIADPDGDAARAFKNSIVPSLFLIDEEGILRHRPNIRLFGTADSLLIISFLTGTPLPGPPGGGPHP